MGVFWGVVVGFSFCEIFFLLVLGRGVESVFGVEFWDFLVKGGGNVFFAGILVEKYYIFCGWRLGGRIPGFVRIYL